MISKYQYFLSKIWTKKNFFFLSIIFALTFIRLINLTADFPTSVKNLSGDLYTDEGWYASNAISAVLTGDWYRPGDFNPAVNLPVNQLIQFAFYKVFGVSLFITRALSVLWFLLLEIAIFLLAKKLVNQSAAIISVLFIASDFTLFAYSRIAFLEIPMVTLAIISLLLATNADRGKIWQTIIFVPFFFIAAMLTKTTAVFVFPAIAYLLITSRLSTKTKLIVIGAVFLLAASLYTLHLVMMRSQYPKDYDYFISLNLAARMKLNPSDAFAMAKNALWYVSKMIGRRFLVISLFGAVVVLLQNNSARRNPMIVALFLMIAGYISVMAVSQYQPVRYMVPGIIIVYVTCGVFWGYLVENDRMNWKLRSAIAGFLFILLIPKTLPIYEYLRHPSYSLISMIRSIKVEIDADHNPKPVLLGSLADTISLGSKIVTINDVLGTADLDWRIQHYSPTHYITLGEITKPPEILVKYYHLQEIASYNVLNNYIRGRVVFLYRLEPIDPLTPK